MAVYIDNQSYMLAPENYIERENDLCAFKIMTMNMNSASAFWIMGIPFFQNYYTVFDQANLRVGLAESKISSLGAQAKSFMSVNNLAGEENNSPKTDPYHQKTVPGATFEGPSIYCPETAEWAMWILGVLALWLLISIFRFYRSQGESKPFYKEEHSHDHDHDHEHGNGGGHHYHDHNPRAGLIN